MPEEAETTTAAGEAKSAKKSPRRSAKKKNAAKKAATKKPPKKAGGATSASRRPPQISSEVLPRKTLEQALRIARALRDVHHGGPIDWRQLAKSAGLGLSQNNKYYLWAAEAYGLVEKENNEFKLTETGRKILAPTSSGEDRDAISKAVLTPVMLSRFFTDYNGHPFPADEHVGNVLEHNYEIPRERIEEAKELIRENGRFAGFLRDQPDGTVLVSIDGLGPSTQPRQIDDSAPGIQQTSADYDSMCFVITPLGDDESEQRRHADLVLKHVITPVAQELGLAPLRADQIDRSGIITRQIFECLARARVCIADLSYGNPNAFYELGVRHMCKLATIQIIRKGDKIPFDVSQGRTIKVDMTDVYAVVDSIESAKRELKQHLKHVISGEYKGEDNPVNVYLPAVVVQIPK